MTLFDECMVALGTDMKILEISEQISLIDLFLDVVPFASWGLIECSLDTILENLEDVVNVSLNM